MHDPTVFAAAFTPEAWRRFVEAGTPTRRPAGDVLLRRGDPPAGVWIVLSGRLDAVDPRSSPPTVLGSYKRGSVLGEMSFLDGSPVSADVRVAEAGEFVHLAPDRLGATLEGDPEVGASFFRGTLSTLLARARRLSSTAVTERAVREDGPDFRYADDLETAWDHRIQELVDRGLDPHLATALADAGMPLAELRVDGERVRVGRSRANEIILPDPRVAPVQAELIKVDGDWRVVSVGSRVAVVGGSPVSSAPLPRDGRFEVGRYALQLRGHRLDVRPMGTPALLEVEGLGRRVGDRWILQDVSFAALSGEVVAIAGPSGAGKSSLLAALRVSDAGRVAFGGEPLAHALSREPALLGEVPQDDILLPELTVSESLRAAAELRLPHLSPAARESAVNALLEDLGLASLADARVGDPERRGLSGGQRKRVNIAVELLSPATRVLVLDEPTSGLDPRATADIARLARRLADQGRVVLLVTHDLGDALLTQVDHLLLLAPGGRLAWYGPPDDAAAHFQTSHPAEIFDRLADRPPAEWAERYQGCDAQRVWVASRFAASRGGLVPPSPTPAAGRPSAVGWLGVLARRAWRVRARDRSSAAVMAAQPTLVAAVMALVFPRATSGLVFLAVLACFWFGMSASVRELIGDRLIWARERRQGVPAWSWVGAKAAVLGVWVGAQAAAVTAAAWLAGGLGSMGFSFSALLMTNVLMGSVGIAIGLLVSASWRRSDAAVGTIALLLIPQIAFSGVLMPLSEVRGPAWALSWLTPVRYGFDLALRAGERFEYLGAGGWFERPLAGELYLLGLRPPGEGLTGPSTAVLVAVLVLCATGSLAAAVLRIRRD